MKKRDNVIKELFKALFKLYPIQMISFIVVLITIIIISINSLDRSGTRSEQMTVVNYGYLGNTSINWDTYEKETDITGTYVKLRDKRNNYYVLDNPDNDTYKYCQHKKGQSVEVLTNTTRKGFFDYEVEIIEINVPLFY